VSARSCAGSFLVSSMISAAQEAEIRPAASASARQACSVSCRIRRTAAFASAPVSCVLAASHADEVPYPSASWASQASNRRRNAACAAVAFALMTPSAARTSPAAAACNSAAAGELR
jgi:hypothetical protein